MGIYNQYLLPKLLDCCCSIAEIEKYRKKWIPYASGNILEVGIGSGLNLPFYKNAKLNKLWGIDPSEELISMASKVAVKEQLDVQFIHGSATQIPLPNNVIDDVIMTYTMCSILEIELVLKEIKRVLKPDGQLIFCEHGRSPDNKVEKWQNRISPIWKILFGGCEINKDIPRLMSDSGYTIQQLERGYLLNTPKIAGYNYAGVATLNSVG